MPHTVLIADDDESLRDLLISLLSEAGYATLSAQDGRAAVDLTLEHRPDVAILDVMMPRMDGFEACRAIKDDPRTAAIPVLLLTALAHTPSKVQGLDCGATDYITKPFEVPELLARLRATLAAKTRRDSLAAEALTDALTGLTNRRGLEQQLDQLLAHAERTDEPLSVILFDADRFKAVNDTYGHDVGDIVLATLARRAQETMRTQDVVGRFGGEEFLSILPGAGREAALAAAERLRTHIAETGLDTRQGPIRVTVSAGVCTTYPGLELGRAALIGKADQAMYAAKRAGGNSVVHADGAPTAPLAFPEPPEAARALVEALALVHPQAAEHARAVARLGWQIGSALRLAPAERARIAIAGLLHDIGLIAVPETAPSNSSADEAGSLSRHNGDEPPQHARVGEELLRGIPTLGSVAELVGAHHEWWDGTGYPRGLRGEEIPLGGRVVAVADAYDTLVRLAGGRRKAAALAATLRQAAGTRLDPGVVSEALRVLPR